MESNSPENSDSAPDASKNLSVSRRKVLAGIAGVAAVAGAVAISRSLQKPHTSEPEQPQVPETPTPSPEQQNQSLLDYAQPFQSSEVNSLMQAKGITTGDYFTPKKETLERLTAFRTADLLPIFPPSVVIYKDLIKELAATYNVPENVVATIITIESTGYSRAKSGAGACGLFQIMPVHFSQEMNENPDLVFDPKLNGTIAMDFFGNSCLPFARTFEEQPSDNAIIYGRAMIDYNGGQGQAALDDDNEIAAQSREYRDYFYKFCIDAELAQALRAQGKSDREIVEALTFNKIDGRAYALNGYFSQHDGSVYDVYHEGMELAAQPDLAQVSPEMEHSYNEYEQTKPYAVPLTPALRIWANVGGLAQLKLSSENMDSEQYYSMSTTT